MREERLTVKRPVILLLVLLLLAVAAERVAGRGVVGLTWG
jgi:hypothetical protein